MLTEPSFIQKLRGLDKRAQDGKSYGFQQGIWAEIVDELEFLNDVLAYIDSEYQGLAHEAAEVIEKARAK